MGRPYKRPFLKTVVVRADFASPSAVMESPVAVERILRIFPIPEHAQVVTQVVEMPPTGEERVIGQNTRTELNFFAKDRSSKVFLAETFCGIQYFSYNDFDELFSAFANVMTTLTEVDSELQIKRLGLRYVNDIRPTNQARPLVWTNLIKASLLAPFKLNRGHKVTRAFQVLELLVDDFNLKFQYGMPNLDYPAPIRQKSFILDMDAYFDGILDAQEVGHMLKRFHAEIESTFEASITDKLRKMMDDERE